MRDDHLLALFSDVVQLQVPLVLAQHLQDVLHVLVVVGDLLQGLVGDDFGLLQKLSEVALGDHQFVLDELAVLALTFLPGRRVEALFIHHDDSEKRYSRTLALDENDRGEEGHWIRRW